MKAFKCDYCGKLYGDFPTKRTFKLRMLTAAETRAKAETFFIDVRVYDMGNCDLDICPRCLRKRILTVAAQLHKEEAS